MAATNTVKDFIEIINECWNNKTFVRVIISNKRDKNQELKTITVKPIQIKKGDFLNFVFRYPTKDITKNHNLEEGCQLIYDALNQQFLQAELITSFANYHLTTNKKGKIKINRNELKKELKPHFAHDKQKKRLISTKNNIYLQELGVTNSDESIKPSMQDKFKQINKYVEIIESVLKPEKEQDSLSVVDMGSGKGYLTFALYDYLQNNLAQKANIIGLEYRSDLVEKCNIVAKKAEYDNLKFIKGSIKEFNIDEIDMLIALHACDTATDDAIYKGIRTNAKYIICAPCCHKQIRKELNPKNELGLITKHGILKERQAEILTDTIRAHILEAFGYSTKVFEFISTEHTPKNVMIVAVRKSDFKTPNKEIISEIIKLKSLYNIGHHHLEGLMGIV